MRPDLAEDGDFGGRPETYSMLVSASGGTSPWRMHK